MNQNPYAQYQQTATQTASRDRLLIMLFEGALRFGHGALAALEEKDYTKVNNNLNRLQDIINELRLTVNPKANSELAQNLLSLYDYFYRRLIEANIKKDPEILKEVLGFLGELKDAFQEAALIYRKEGGSLG